MSEFHCERRFRLVPCRHPLLLGDYLLARPRQPAPGGGAAPGGAPRRPRRLSNRKDDGDLPGGGSGSDTESDEEQEARRTAEPVRTAASSVGCQEVLTNKRREINYAKARDARAPTCPAAMLAAGGDARGSAIGRWQQRDLTLGAPGHIVAAPFKHVRLAASMPHEPHGKTSMPPAVPGLI